MNYTLSTVYFANSVASAIPSETQGHSGSPSFVPASVHRAEDINQKDGVSTVNCLVLILYVFFFFCLLYSKIWSYRTFIVFGLVFGLLVGKKTMEQAFIDKLLVAIVSLHVMWNIFFAFFCFRACAPGSVQSFVSSEWNRLRGGWPSEKLWIFQTLWSSWLIVSVLFF